MKTCPQCRATAADDTTFCQCGYCFPPPSTSGPTPPNLPATAQLGGVPLVFAALFLAGAIFLIRECASRDPEVSGAYHLFSLALPILMMASAALVGALALRGLSPSKRIASILFHLLVGIAAIAGSVFVAAHATPGVSKREVQPPQSPLPAPVPWTVRAKDAWDKYSASIASLKEAEKADPATLKTSTDLMVIQDRLDTSKNALNQLISIQSTPEAQLDPTCVKPGLRNVDAGTTMAAFEKDKLTARDEQLKIIRGHWSDWIAMPQHPQETQKTAWWKEYQKQQLVIDTTRAQEIKYRAALQVK